MLIECQNFPYDPHFLRIDRIDIQEKNYLRFMITKMQRGGGGGGGGMSKFPLLSTFLKN